MPDFNGVGGKGMLQPDAVVKLFEDTQYAANPSSYCYFILNYNIYAYHFTINWNLYA